MEILVRKIHQDQLAKGGHILIKVLYMYHLPHIESQLPLWYIRRKRLMIMLTVSRIQL